MAIYITFLMFVSLFHLCSIFVLLFRSKKDGLKTLIMINIPITLFFLAIITIYLLLLPYFLSVDENFLILIISSSLVSAFLLGVVKNKSVFRKQISIEKFENSNNLRLKINSILKRYNAVKSMNSLLKESNSEDSETLEKQYSVMNILLSFLDKYLALLLRELFLLDLKEVFNTRENRLTNMQSLKAKLDKNYQTIFTKYGVEDHDFLLLKSEYDKLIGEDFKSVVEDHSKKQLQNILRTFSPLEQIDSISLVGFTDVAKQQISNKEELDFEYDRMIAEISL